MIAATLGRHSGQVEEAVSDGVGKALRASRRCGDQAPELMIKIEDGFYRVMKSMLLATRPTF